jgi:hypothetical protein
VNVRLEEGERQQARRVARSEFVTRLFILVGAVFLAGSMVTNVVLSVAIRQTQLDGTPVGKKLVESADRILDCTEAGGPGRKPGACYTRSQTQARDVLASAQRIILISAACAVELNPSDPVEVRVQQITTCVTERLTKKP